MVCLSDTELPARVLLYDFTHTAFTAQTACNTHCRYTYRECEKTHCCLALPSHGYKRSLSRANK